MAASTKETGWVYLFEQVLKTKQPDATFTGLNIYDWEVDYLNVNLSELLDSELSEDADLVIFRAGENNSNVTSQSEYEQGIERLIQYVINRCHSATIIMTSLFWHNTLKENAIRNVALKYGFTYIYTESVGDNRCRMGDYTKGGDGELHPITNNGVAGHMNDIGFSQWVSILSKALGYNFNTNLRNISVNDTLNIGYTCYEKWAVGGIFNIRTSSNNVTASYSGGSIPVTNHNDGVFTFIMPDGDVTINIS